MSLRLDWCSYEATKFACTNWHYSRSVPAGKLMKVGVWAEKGGANPTPTLQNLFEDKISQKVVKLA